MRDDITRRIDRTITDDILRYSTMDAAMAYAAIVTEWPEQIAVLILELLFGRGEEKRQDGKSMMLAKKDGNGSFFTILYPDRKTHPYMR
ncbi:MAG: hypothetical protein KGJ13_09220 [Patescibacteria group bacterium]|nr:hypothetical protein [Patescibacteria group bacterium]